MKTLSYSENVQTADLEELIRTKSSAFREWWDNQ